MLWVNSSVGWLSCKHRSSVSWRSIIVLQDHTKAECGGLITPGPRFRYLFKFWGVQLPLRQNASTQPYGDILRRVVSSSSRSFSFPGLKRTRISTETSNDGFGQWAELWQTTSKFPSCYMFPFFPSWTTASTHGQESRCIPRGYQSAESRRGVVISGKFCPFEKHMEKVHPVIPQEPWSPLLIIHIRQEKPPSREALQVSALLRNKQVIP